VITPRRQLAASSDEPEWRRGRAGRGLVFAALPPGRRWLLPVAVAAATAAWLSGVASGRVAGEWRVVLMACGAVFTAAATGVPLWQQARAAQARADAVAAAQEARVAMRVALQDALDPFAALLAQIATVRPRQKPLLRGEAIELALTTIVQISQSPAGAAQGEHTRLRACYFTLDRGPPRRLIAQTYAGRAGGPTVVLDETTQAGQFLLRIAGSGWTVIEDLHGMHTPVWWDQEHQYRAFAAGPVPGLGDEPTGLLVIDALHPVGLAGVDLALVKLIARLLGLALRT
jgi:hypothetical protein